MRSPIYAVLLALGLVACGDDAESTTSTLSTTSGAESTTGSTSMSDSTGTITATGLGEFTAATPPPDESTTGPDSDTDDDGQDSTMGDGASGSSTGPMLPDGQWAITEITYASGATQEVLQVDDCVFCDATLNDVTLLVRFQQAEGWTVWTIDIPVGSGVGAQPITDDFSGAYVAINETGPALPPELTGFYDPTSASGTLTLTEADLTPGGVVAGTISVQLSQGSATADLQAEFYAEIP